MTLFPASKVRPGEVILDPWSYQSLGLVLQRMNTAGPLAVAWPAAGLVIFVPFWVPEPVTITKLFMGVGAAAGNLDCGIYAEDQTRLVSAGTTAAAGTIDLQVFDIADTTLARGRYYMAGVASTVTTLTLMASVPLQGICQSLGLLEQAGITLPLSTGASPATFAKYTRAYMPLIGAQGYRSIGP